MKNLNSNKNPLLGYGCAIAATFSALVLTRWTIPVVHRDAFDFFQGAVVLTAWYGGLGPGLLATAISTLSLDYYFIPPVNEFSYGKTDLIRLAIFGVVAVLTSSLSDKLKQSKLRLEEAQDKLESRIEERTRELMEAEREVLDISNHEQRRLGQDLHDGLCQILVGVKLTAETLKDRLSEKGSSDREEVALIESRLSEALGQADVVSRGLYPVELETNGLMSALEDLAYKMSRAFPVQCRFVCRKPVYFGDMLVGTNLYRIAQEAVMNAIKGGKASMINIRLTFQESHVRLIIADNGIGFQNGVKRKGMGLKIMGYRANVIGAQLIFRSRKSGGTYVVCSLPAQNIKDSKEIVYERITI